MRLASPAFPRDGLIPMRYTADDLGVSPPLRWQEVPEGTLSLALSLVDRDAPVPWVHWLVCNIHPEASGIPDGGPLPRGGWALRNDFRRSGYTGPCPRFGEHRYFFTLYALDVSGAEMRRAGFFEFCHRHLIEKAELLGRYQKGGYGLGAR